MVSMQSRKKSGSRLPISFMTVLYIVMGIATSYVLVLLSFASSNNTTGNGAKNIKEAIVHEEPSTRGAQTQRPPTPIPSVTAGSTRTISVQPNSSLAPLALSTGTRRGRNNFRNVVVKDPSSSRFFSRVRKAGWVGKPHGEGVNPQTIVPKIRQETEGGTQLDENGNHPDPDHILKAYVEPIDFQEWTVKPLPVRSTATADQLEVIAFPKLNACSRLPERWPADEYPDHDPFLPWIHDVFPTHDGRYIQFVAQNRRRCHTGNTAEEKEILHLMQPNIALFQHVPVKRIRSTNTHETRYKLCSHEEADPDGVATRFICRFKPSMQETLSQFNFDYDFAAHRKRNKRTFKYQDGGILSVHTSQLIFQCPVPEDLVELVKSGDSVKDDWATLFVDVIPIRTPPRYGLSTEFLQPKYADRLPEKLEERFDPAAEWGGDHVLPCIEDSGRWENVPICKPVLEEYYPLGSSQKKPPDMQMAGSAMKQIAIQDHLVAAKKHRLVACIWASAGYTTRGNRFAVNDGQRRLQEWIVYNKLLGFEHFYLYDNSYAFSSETTLKPIADQFPNDVTYIKWPFQVCNNNPNNVDSPGERSSQYAAESSCRLRFGPHVEWLGQYDIDEYIVPMGSYKSLLPILDSLDQTGTKILSFGSWRAWPRRDLIEPPVPIHDPKQCNNQFACFELHVPMNTTVLQTYNCDRQFGPKKDTMPAEKQLYRPDYVLQHFIHYSSVTVLSDMSRSEFETAGFKWLRTRVTPDPLSRFSDELNEATMLHTKAIARQDTAGWQSVCKVGNDDKRAKCRVGVPFPEHYNKKHGPGDEKGWAFNCYVNRRAEHYWVPLLEQALESHRKSLTSA